MSHSILKGRERAKSAAEGDGSSRWRGVFLPEVLIIVCTAVLIWFFRKLLADAQQSDIQLATLLPLFLAVLGIVMAAAILVISQASRSAKRLSGPSSRLMVAMQRTRRGDLAHRVHLRHGDGFKELAAEFNRLLDWLNANPPSGVTTVGTDLVEMSENLEDMPGEDVGKAMSELEDEVSETKAVEVANRE